MYTQRFRKLKWLLEAFYNILRSLGHAYVDLLMPQILSDIHFPLGSSSVFLRLAHLPSSYPCGGGGGKYYKSNSILPSISKWNFIQKKEKRVA